MSSLISKRTCVPLLAAAWLAATPLRAGHLSASIEVRVGHWLEVRGHLSSEDVFQGEEAEILPPQKYDVLIGTVEKQGGELLLLGRTVETSEETRWRDLGPDSLSGARVKVEGSYRPPGRFEAAKISPRGAGRERLGGRVDRVLETPNGIEVRIMDFRVLLPPSVEHREPLADLIPADGRRGGPGFGGQSEDDIFGEGIRITDGLRLTGQVEVRAGQEGNFDLDTEDAEDRLDLSGALRLRLEWRATERVATVLEFRQSALYREDEEDGSLSRDNRRLGETYVFIREVLGPDLDLQIGRQDFDDPREWIYDQNLDAVRLIARRPSWRLEISGSTMLSDASPRDLDSTNLIAYLSNNDPRRHLAAYALHRRIDAELAEETTHAGVRALGRWLPDNESWLELALFRGSIAATRMEGWAFDLGSTWNPRFAGPLSITLAYAVGSGDASPGESDRTFRQTGFHDNNGKFGGVTSFRYYGELMEPELANLKILTAGLGLRVARRTSLDLVVHHYRQYAAAARLVDSELDMRPDGVHPDLGWELDLIFGSRAWRSWDFEAVGSWFEPGDAFPEDADSAYLAKLQLRYRF